MASIEDAGVEATRGGKAEESQESGLPELTRVESCGAQECQEEDQGDSAKNSRKCAAKGQTAAPLLFT
jgi:hypothetical protein